MNNNDVYVYFKLTAHVWIGKLRELVSITFNFIIDDDFYFIRLEEYPFYTWETDLKSLKKLYEYDKEKLHWLKKIIEKAEKSNIDEIILTNS